MAMPKNIKFERRVIAGPEFDRIREREVKTGQIATRLERQTKIDRDELEARTLLAEREMAFKGSKSPSSEAAKQILDVYNKVVVDGRHVGVFLTQPKAAAELVGMELSDEAAEWILKDGNLASAIDFGGNIGNVASPAVVAVAVIVVVLEVTHAPGEDFVLDPAGQLKL